MQFDAIFGILSHGGAASRPLSVPVDRVPDADASARPHSTPALLVHEAYIIHGIRDYDPHATAQAAAAQDGEPETPAQMGTPQREQLERKEEQLQRLEQEQRKVVEELHATTARAQQLGQALQSAVSDLDAKDEQLWQIESKLQEVQTQLEMSRAAAKEMHHASMEEFAEKVAALTQDKSQLEKLLACSKDETAEIRRLLREQEAQVAQLSRQNQDKGRIEDELALLQRENTEMNAELAELRLQARDFVELERKNRAMAQLIAQHWTPVNGEQDGGGGGGMRGANDVAAGGVDVDGREAGVDAGADAPGLCKCTLGFSYSEANSIITDVIPGGPAHYSNKVFVGDTIVAVDGVHVRGAEIARCFEGVHKPGSILHLTLKRQSGVVEQVAMRRMAKELFDHHAFSALQTQLGLLRAELADEKNRSQTTNLRVQDLQMLLTVSESKERNLEETSRELSRLQTQYSVEVAKRDDEIQNLKIRIQDLQMNLAMMEQDQAETIMAHGSKHAQDEQERKTMLAMLEQAKHQAEKGREEVGRLNCDYEAALVLAKRELEGERDAACHKVSILETTVAQMTESVHSLQSELKSTGSAWQRAHARAASWEEEKLLLRTEFRRMIPMLQDAIGDAHAASLDLLAISEGQAQMSDVEGKKTESARDALQLQEEKTQLARQVLELQTALETLEMQAPTCQQQAEDALNTRIFTLEKQLHDSQVMALLLECELEKRGCLIEKDGTHYHIHDTVPSSAVASLESSGPADQGEFDRGRGAGIRRREAGGLVCGASIAGTMGTDGGVKEEQFAGTRLHNGTGRSSSGDVTASRPPSGTSVWQIVAPHPDRAAKDTHRRISASASFHGAGAQHLGAPPSHHGRGRPGSAQPGSVSSRSAFW